MNSFIKFPSLLINHSLIPLHSFAFYCPVIRARPLLFFKPLSGNIRVSSQTPVVVVIPHKDVDVPEYEEEDAIYKASVYFIRSLNY